MPSATTAQETSPRPFQTVAREASTCTLCHLHEGRTNVVFGSGRTDADIMVVGVAPGRHEDLAARPFVGASGNLLNNLFADAGVARDDIYLTTVVKCRPPGGRRPHSEEILTCAPYLREQIDAVEPAVILTLGEMPTRLLLRRDIPVERIAGYRLPFHNATLIATHDPTDALRGSPPAMAALRRDIRTAKAVAEGLVPPADGSIAKLLGGAPGSSTK